MIAKFVDNFRTSNYVIFYSYISSTFFRQVPGWMFYLRHCTTRFLLHTTRNRRPLVTFRHIYSLMSSSPTLSQFLASQKDRYLNDVSKGLGNEWTIVMGNEAGGEPNPVAQVVVVFT
jgi:hypothetical protein